MWVGLFLSWWIFLKSNFRQLFFYVWCLIEQKSILIISLLYLHEQLITYGVDLDTVLANFNVNELLKQFIFAYLVFPLIR